jgi:hypothetical protein
MKKFLFTLAALLMAGSAFAGNVYIPDTEFTEDQIGKVQLLPVYLVLDNEYVNGWDFVFEYPEGLTVGSLKKNNAVLNQTAAINEDGDEETVSVVLNGDAYHNIGAIIQGGYWDPDGDGVYELYGAVKIGPTGEFKLYEIRVTPTEEFKGGDITITWMYSGGFDNRNGQPKCQDSGVTTVHLTAPSVPEPEVTEKPVITSVVDEEAQTVTITATGAGEVILYNDDVEVARGEGVAEYVVPFTEDPEGEEMGFSATAQEPGKEVSEYAVATVEIPGKPVTPPEPEVTAVPEVNVNVTEDAVIITAVGDGEVVLYVNDEAVENPYTIARPEAGEEAVTYYVYATAQETGKEMSESEVMPVVVEPKAGETPSDPHMTGVWIVTINKDNGEEWKEMAYDDGDYTSIVRMEYDTYGTFPYNPALTMEENDAMRPNVRYYIVIDGVRYGAAEDGTLTVLGEALNNPLYEGENFYVLEHAVGRVYQMGVAVDPETNNMYVYAAVAAYTDVEEMNAAKTVAGVRYFNMAGQEMQKAEGMTIVVTTYTDGTTSAVKVVK